MLDVRLGILLDRGVADVMIYSPLLLFGYAYTGFVWRRWKGFI